MKSNRYNTIRLAAGLLTVLVVLAHEYLPKKRLLLFPNPSIEHVIYGADDRNGVVSASWLDESTETWRCNFEDEANFFCGYSLYFPAVFDDFSKGVDLSGYEGINLRIRYQGEAQRLRLFLRNYNSAYATNGEWDSTKFMSINPLTEDLRGDAFFKLSEFGVADWWLLARDIGRAHAAPEFEAVVAFGIDFVTPGTHTVAVEEIELVGAWIAPEQLYLSIITFWLTLVFWEGGHRFYLMRVHSSKANEVISDLVSSYQRLEVRRKEYQALSTTDVLTGAMNRAGINKFTDALFASGCERSSIGVMLLDIDHFKSINDQCGHDTGDQILQEVAQLVSANTRENDAFGRWGGEEFIIVSQQSSPHSLASLAEKLREKIAAHAFAARQPLRLTISIGATMAAQDEPFQAAFKRADQALYRAKNNGRNRVEFGAA